MTAGTIDTAAASRLARLLSYLEMDKNNLALLADAAETAVTADRAEVARQCLDRYAAQATLPPALRNLEGIIALSECQFDAAADHFSLLRLEAGDAAPLRLNQAYALAMADRHAEAAPLLDAAAVAASPRGPALKVQVLHHLGDLELAMTEGLALAERYPDDQALMGALATLAMDADDIERASMWAARAPDSPQGLAALGMFALDSQDADQAAALFDRALALQPDSARATIGKGLAELARGNAAAGADALEAGAARFGSHLGSWIGAAWARLIAGDPERAMALFERAEALDGNFPEVHGGLAVLAVLRNDKLEAQRRAEIALRLDRESLGGTLANILLLQADGNTDQARRIFELAAQRPLTAGGKTLAQALAGLSRTH